jgi:hypothetical protein
MGRVGGTAVLRSIRTASLEAHVYFESEADVALAPGKVRIDPTRTFVFGGGTT